jgi:PDZ domain-containing protein
MLTTITVSQQRLTAWAAFVGWLDPTITVVEEKAVIGDQDRDAVRQFNLQMMMGSQDVATYVALETLGYDVGVTGTGVFVVDVVEGSAAEGALEPGDTIVAIDGQPVLVASDLIDTLSTYSPGDTVELGVEHLDEPDSEVVEVTLGAREDDPSAPLLGVQPHTRDGAFVFPEGVDVVFVDSGIGGPSAGLAFTLTIIDEMTPGDLTGGATIAVTGEIRADGSVGRIGGVEQKAVTVRRAGVDVFLVPAGIPEAEMAAARRQAGDAVQIIEVATLDEALDVLESLGGEPVEEIAPDA